MALNLVFYLMSRTILELLMDLKHLSFHAYFAIYLTY